MQRATKGQPIIRPLSLKDCDAVSNVIQRCLREVNIRDYGEEHIAQMLPTFAPNNLPEWFKGAEPYVLTMVDEIVAIGAIRDHDIQTVFVLPDRHGEGFGKQLMRFLEERIKDKGFSEATLNSSLTSKDFYVAFGYECKAETHGGVGGRMFAMSKRL
jgi:GNAT superfamily N-acetyltransferase